MKKNLFEKMIDLLEDLSKKEESSNRIDRMKFHLEEFKDDRIHLELSSMRFYEKLEIYSEYDSKEYSRFLYIDIIDSLDIDKEEYPDEFRINILKFDIDILYDEKSIDDFIIMNLRFIIEDIMK